MASLRAVAGFGVVLLPAFLLAAPAAAQERAPISYLGATPAPAASPAAPRRIAALTENYSYGAQQRPAAAGLLDLTRPANRQASRDPDLLAPPADPEELQNEPDGPEDAEPAAASPQILRPETQWANAAAAQPAQAQNRPAWLERERVGPPYEVNGRTYVPTPEPGYEQTGLASWYGPDFHGRPTANGETYDQEGLTAAHPTLPLNSLVQVTNVANGREAIVRINDRGPFVGDRLIDLSRRTADVLGFEAHGTARVHVRYLGPAPRRYGAGEGAQAALAAPSPAAPAAEPFIGTPLRPSPSEAPLAQTAGAEAPAGGAYVVQVGAFSDLSNAHRVRAALETAGQVLVEPRQTARGEVFRVRVVGFQSRGAAEAGRAQVASLGYPEAIVATP